MVQHARLNAGSVIIKRNATVKRSRGLHIAASTLSRRISLPGKTSGTIRRRSSTKPSTSLQQNGLDNGFMRESFGVTEEWKNVIDGAGEA